MIDDLAGKIQLARISADLARKSVVSEKKKNTSLQKEVHFLVDIYIRRNTKEEHINIINKFSNGITYRSEKEYALKLLKDILMPNIVNYLIDLKYIEKSKLN
jgi:hypothetical protein